MLKIMKINNIHVENHEKSVKINHYVLQKKHQPNSTYKEELEAYVSLYLKEEIKNEALTRNVQAFSEFLDLIALSNGQEINYEGFSKDLQISPSTLKNYIEILY